MSVFGTRPEAIKMAPIIKAIEKSDHLKSVVCITGQHTNLLDQVLEIFDITPDFNLKLMKPNQDLFDITIGCLSKLKEVFKMVCPDCVLVHGDTTTTFSTALCAYYSKIPIGHVEAGLRTGNKYSPFPEEMNRHMISPLVDYHFAPTENAVTNLLLENTTQTKIFQTGNSAIDALFWATNKYKENRHLDKMFHSDKMILMTAHRRENFGEPLKNIFTAVRLFAEMNSDFQIVYPVHPNPNVKKIAEEILGPVKNVSLISPLSYLEMGYLLKRCRFILTDSGGLQEEAPAFGKPVLVLRNTTERPEAIEAGCAKLVGSNINLILDSMNTLAKKDSEMYSKMSQVANPFGDGKTAKRIVNILESKFVDVEQEVESEIDLNGLIQPSIMISPETSNSAQLPDIGKD